MGQEPKAVGLLESSHPAAPACLSATVSGWAARVGARSCGVAHTPHTCPEAFGDPHRAQWEQRCCSKDLVQPKHVLQAGLQSLSSL